MAQLGQPRFVDSGALTIVGLVGRYTPDTLSNIPTHWTEARGSAALVSGRVGGDTYGVWYDVLKGGGAFTYLAGVRVGEFAPIHPTLSRSIIPPRHYAVFQHQGSVRDIRATTDAILGQWLPKSGRQTAPAVDGAPDFFERYSDDFAQTGAGAIEVWLPIKK